MNTVDYRKCPQKEPLTVGGELGWRGFMVIWLCGIALSLFVYYVTNVVTVLGFKYTLLVSVVISTWIVGLLGAAAMIGEKAAQERKARSHYGEE